MRIGERHLSERNLAEAEPWIVGEIRRLADVGFGLRLVAEIGSVSCAVTPYSFASAAKSSFSGASSSGFSSRFARYALYELPYSRIFGAQPVESIAHGLLAFFAGDFLANLVGHLFQRFVFGLLGLAMLVAGMVVIRVLVVSLLVVVVCRVAGRPLSADGVSVAGWRPPPARVRNRPAHRLSSQLEISHPATLCCRPVSGRARWRGGRSGAAGRLDARRLAAGLGRCRRRCCRRGAAAGGAAGLARGPVFPAVHRPHRTWARQRVCRHRRPARPGRQRRLRLFRFRHPAPHRQLTTASDFASGDFSGGNSSGAVMGRLVLFVVRLHFFVGHFRGSPFGELVDVGFEVLKGDF